MGDTILTGHRDPNTNKLWEIDLDHQAPEQANLMATASSTTPADMVAFAHAALFSPVPSTLREALKKKYIINMPGLTLEAFNKHTPNSVATAKGHLN
ncbi:hypothetical protein SEMRO_754_G197490.1 [Seminavis robusta]|uniref:Uncharacterized protein n=1 Tax=Seminavis robusta TaxID=568900 RepID=A0A9N8HI39_9STRA|nr:hypothetical protein SEMRO_754_G197490.1 [Seminavis robusta]|eukprot:Sro754_g197490.1 n/a (97) ;mRNA; f:8031-8321